MPNVLEIVGEKTIEHLDYVGSLNIQWWATVRAMLYSLPFVGKSLSLAGCREPDARNRRRCNADGFLDVYMHGIHFRHARGVRASSIWGLTLRS